MEQEIADIIGKYYLLLLGIFTLGKARPLSLSLHCKQSNSFCPFVYADAGRNKKFES
jgi:hypothetical protein